MTAAVADRRSGLSRSGTADRSSRSHRGQPRMTRRPQLRLLDERAVRARARRRNALLTMFLVVLVGFFGVAFVHAELVAGQHELDVIRAEIAHASAHRARVERSVEEASSPQSIVARAAALGMVRAYQPVYLVPDGPAPEVPPITFGPAAAGDPVPALLTDPQPRRVELIAAPASAHDPRPQPIEPATDGGAVPAAVIGTDTDVELAAPAVANPVPVAADLAPPGSVAGASARIVGADPPGADPTGESGTTLGGASAGGASVGGTAAAAEAGARPTSTIAGSRAVSEGIGSG